MHSFETAGTVGEQHAALEGVILVAALTAKISGRNLGGIRLEGHTTKYAPEIGKAGLRHSLAERGEPKVLIQGLLESCLHVSSVHLPREMDGKRSITAIRYEIDEAGELEGVAIADPRLPDRPTYWSADPVAINPVFGALGRYVRTILHTSFAILPHHAYMYAQHPSIPAIPYAPLELEIYRPRRQE